MKETGWWMKVQVSILYICLWKEFVFFFSCCCFLQVWDWSHTWETEKAGERPEHQRAGAKGARAATKDVGAEAHRTVQLPGESLISPSSPWRASLSHACLLEAIRRTDVCWSGEKKCGSQRRDEEHVRALLVSVQYWQQLIHLKSTYLHSQFSEKNKKNPFPAFSFFPNIELKRSFLYLIFSFLPSSFSFTCHSFPPAASQLWQKL